jgi:hypothetical protein
MRLRRKLLELTGFSGAPSRRKTAGNNCDNSGGTAGAAAVSATKENQQRHYEGGSAATPEFSCSIRSVIAWLGQDDKGRHGWA